MKNFKDQLGKPSKLELHDSEEEVESSSSEEEVSNWISFAYNIKKGNFSEIFRLKT